MEETLAFLYVYWGSPAKFVYSTHREKAVCAEVSETCLDSPNSLYMRPLFSLPCLKPAHISLPCICFHYWPRPPSLHSLGWQPESTVEQGAYVYTICFSIKEKTCSLLLLIGAANDPIQHLSPASQHKNLYLVLCGEYTYTFRRTKKKKILKWNWHCKQQYLSPQKNLNLKWLVHSPSFGGFGSRGGPPIRGDWRT